MDDEEEEDEEEGEHGEHHGLGDLQGALGQGQEDWEVGVDGIVAWCWIIFDLQSYLCDHLARRLY